MRGIAPLRQPDSSPPTRLLDLWVGLIQENIKPDIVRKDGVLINQQAPISRQLSHYSWHK